MEQRPSLGLQILGRRGVGDSWCSLSIRLYTHSPAAIAPWVETLFPLLGDICMFPSLAAKLRPPSHHTQPWPKWPFRLGLAIDSLTAVSADLPQLLDTLQTIQ